MRKRIFSFKGFVVFFSLVLGMISTIVAFAEPLNTIAFVNQTGDVANVKVIGPSSKTINVPQGHTETVNVEAGEYYILVRYGHPGNYSYTKGDPFTVVQTADQRSSITITLHKVIDGNYSTKSSSRKEFENARVEGSKVITTDGNGNNSQQLIEKDTSKIIKVSNMSGWKATNNDSKLQDMANRTLGVTINGTKGETITGKVVKNKLGYVLFEDHGEIYVHQAIKEDGTIQVADGSAVEILISVLSDKDYMFRQKALGRLIKVTSQDFGEDQKKWQAWYESRKEK